MTKRTLLNAMKNPVVETTTANGAKSFLNTGSKLVDMLSEFGSALPLQKGKNTKDYTDKDAERVLYLFKAAFKENPLYAVRLLFYFRDVRGGGKLKVAVTKCLQWMAINYTDIALKLIKYVPEYGYWEDFIYLLDTPIGKDVALFWHNQIFSDMISLNSEDYSNISLAAKWFPSERSGNISQKAYEKIAAFAGYRTTYDKKLIRQRLSALRKHLRIVETLNTENKWSEINYSHVPSNAMKMYSKAFAKNDAVRFAEFHNKVERGEAKINATAHSAVDIIYGMKHREFATLLKENDQIAENFWNALKSPENLPNILVMVDTSASMNRWNDFNSNQKYKPIDISVALGFYFAGRLPKDSAFYNHIITFSERPTLVELGQKTLRDKLGQLVQDNSNTDIDKAFRLVLDTAVENTLSQEDMPEYIMIVSDGQYDGQYRESNFDTWTKKFAKKGYKLPTIISWNVGNYNTKPTTSFQEGSILLSGFCEALLSNVLQGKFAATPEDGLRKIVEENPRYNVIEIN